MSNIIVSGRGPILVGSLQKGLIFDAPLTSEWTQPSTTVSDRSSYRNHLTDAGVGTVTVGEDGTTFSGGGYLIKYVDGWRYGIDYVGTFTCWVKTLDGEGALISSNQFGVNNQWELFISGGRLRYGVTGMVSWFGLGSVNDNQWHHVGVRSDGSKVTMFIDGEIDRDDLTPARWIGHRSGRTTIGIGARPGVGVALNGTIKYEKMWNRALSLDEIRLDRDLII